MLMNQPNIMRGLQLNKLKYYDNIFLDMADFRCRVCGV